MIGTIPRKGPTKIKGEVRIPKKDLYELTQNERFVLACRRDPVFAVESMIGTTQNKLPNVRLHWVQRDIIQNVWVKQFAMLLMGRGCSKTSTMALYFATYAMLFPGTRLGCFAPSFRQAKFILNEINEKFWPKSPVLKASCKDVVKFGNADASLSFKNGSKIVALPLGDGGKIRGERFNKIYIDEYLEVDEDIVNTVIFPFLNVKIEGMEENQLIIGSTSSFKWNHVWKQYVYFMVKTGQVKELMHLANPSRYYLACYDLRDINTPNAPFSITQEIIDQQRINATDELFGMENLNLFPDEGSGFFDSQLVLKTAATTDFDQMKCDESSDKDDIWYGFGIDAARSENQDASNFSLSIIMFKDGKKYFVKNVSRHGASYQEMISVIRQNHVDFGLNKVRTIGIGAGGGGTTLKDYLAEPWTDIRSGILYDPILDPDDDNHEYIKSTYRILTLYNETSTFNNAMYQGLKADMQHGRTKIVHPVRRSHDKQEEEKIGRAHV